MPQYSEEEIEDLKSTKEKMQTMGTVIFVIIVIGYFALNKFISAMEKLIFQLQFFAYISTWSINYGPTVGPCLKEIKRVALAEFFNDFQVSQRVMNEIFGIKEDDSVGEKVGESRLGSSSIMDNFGFTMILISAVLAVIILLITLAAYVIKKTGYQGKFQKQIKSL